MGEPPERLTLTPADVASTFCAVAENAGMGVLIGALDQGLAIAAIQACDHLFHVAGGKDFGQRPRPPLILPVHPRTTLTR